MIYWLTTIFRAAFLTKRHLGHTYKADANGCVDPAIFCPYSQVWIIDGKRCREGGIKVRPWCQRVWLSIVRPKRLKPLDKDWPHSTRFRKYWPEFEEQKEEYAPYQPPPFEGPDILSGVLDL